MIQTRPKRFSNMPSKSAFQKNSWHTVNEILENWAKNGSGSVEIKTWIATVRNDIVSIETNLTKHEEIVILWHLHLLPLDLLKNFFDYLSNYKII